MTPKEAAKITWQVRARLRKKPGSSLPGLATLFCTRLWGFPREAVPSMNKDFPSMNKDFPRAPVRP